MAKADLGPGERGAQRLGKLRRHEVAERLPLLGEHGHRGQSAGAGRLDEAGDGGEHLRQRRVARHLLEHLALCARQALAALALGDVGDAAAYQATIAARQLRQAHLADDLVPGAVDVRPLVHRHLALERLLHVAARALGGSSPVRLLRRADRKQSDLEQPCALEAEQLLRVVVRIHEAPGIHVEHHDGLGRMIDQQAVARRALAHRLFGLAPLGHIAQADDEHLAPRERRLADGDLRGKGVAVLAARPQLARGQIERGVAERRSQALQRLGNGVVGGKTRQQQIDALTDHLGLIETEHPLAGGIEGAHHALLVHREHHVLDVIENDLQMLRALLARLERQRPRLIGHQAHRLDNSAPLVVDRQVVIVDDAQQQPEIDRRAPGAQLQLLQLRAQLRVHIGMRVTERPRVLPNERSRGARGGTLGVGARSEGLRL